MRRALEDVAALGPFFAVSSNPAEEVDPTWTPWRAFYDAPATAAARIDLVARALNTDDRRVAASIALQGLAARLVSPILAVAAAHRLVPRWSPESLHWRPAVSGPWPMWESGTALPCGDGSGPDDAVLTAMVAEVLVEPHLAALIDVTGAAESVSGRVLRGNIASAVAGAGAMIARTRPAAARTCAVIVEGLLRTRLLSDSGRFEGAWSFRRRSCCLYYRIPGGGTCGDCVLVPVARRP